MTAPDFSALLREAMGLDIATVGAATVDSAVRRRLGALGMDDPAAYLDLLEASASERQALIEAVVIPETWFFRDREAFAALARHATTAWRPRDVDSKLRLLSVPCSSGEEPYSMAMALLDAGFPIERCHIDAVDISAQALARARHGMYRRNSFRGEDLDYRARHFSAGDDGYRIHDAVRRPVHFHQGNLLADQLLHGAGPYDAIFCRNLLIYFDREAQDDAFTALTRRLGADGLLFVGPSEGGLALRHGFDSLRIPLSFGFRRARTVPARVRAPASRPPRRAGVTPVRSVSVPPPPCTAVTPAAAPPDPVSSPLECARRLADQGDLEAAAHHCTESLRQHGPHPDAYHLLGLIAAAGGDTATAGDCYRKALYLDPSHYETLVHLSLLLAKLGDAAGARVLRSRIQRLATAGCGT